VQRTTRGLLLSLLGIISTVTSTQTNSICLYEMDLPMSGVLARMEQAGMALDLPYLAGFSEELTRDLSTAGRRDI